MPATPVSTPDYSGILNLPTTQHLDALADSLEVALNGGQASDDSPYPWPYLRLCVQVAADAEAATVETQNLAILQADYLARKKDELESYYLDLKSKAADWDTPDADIQAFPAPLLLDADRQEYYFLVPDVVVNLRRYQNLPSERTVREVRPRLRYLRDKYQFVQLTTGHAAHRTLPGGLLGCWGYYTEQDMAAFGNQHRVYLEPPKYGAKLPDNFALIADYVVRSSRTSGLPGPPLVLVQNARIYQAALNMALLRTREDRAQDANPSPTQAQ